MTKPYVQSGYERIVDDNYQTIDPRCVRALIDTIYISRQARIVDCCAPNGSGIVDQLQNLSYIAYGIEDAFEYVKSDWIVSNPPYKRGIVDKIIKAQINRLGETTGVAMLLRNNFDFAKSRYNMFTSPFYYGQIHMLFRPIWIKPVPGEKKIEPIHNFVWHIWKANYPVEPVVKYWREK